MECIIRGKRISTEKNSCFSGVYDAINRDLQNDLPNIRKVIASLDRLGEYINSDVEFLIDELMEIGYAREEAIQIKKDSLAVLSAEELFKKINRELGGLPFEISRLSSREEEFEAWMPVGVLGHVTSSNDAMLPFFSSVEGILTGNINLIKTASTASKIVMKMVEKLCEMDETLCPYFYVFPLSSKDTDLLKEMFSMCSTVAVWGSDKAVEGVRSTAPSGVDIVEWGSRISFAYITKNGCTADVMRGLCEDVCVNDQQACSAPQVVYYETDSRDELVAFAKELMHVMQEVSDTYPLHPISSPEQAEITGQSRMCRLEEIMGDAVFLEGNGCRLFVKFDNELCASPLYRTLIVKAINRKDVVNVLRPFRAYLQSVGLACTGDELVELSRLMYAGGVTRITNPGLMMAGYTGEPHDGVYAMTRYLKRVSLINTSIPKGVMSFGEMTVPGDSPFEDGTPLLNKENFPEENHCKDSGYLLLKSGGSSGKAKYAPHSYADAQVTYEETARFIIAAGVDPKKDVCMNLFYAGGLYGGFISIYEALKLADVVQLPMTAEMDMEYVANEIVNNKVNVLVGMPTYLIRLFHDQKDKLQQYGGVEKVLYGGEHFDPAQVAQLKEMFGIKIIGSLAYGCNEIGSMGYACEHCSGGVHHVTATKYLEILKLDSDAPVAPGETGRLVWTPVDQENNGIKRYEIGDLGRWVTEPCPCGRQAPRFELLGRFGDVFKFATNYVNYKKIKSIFAEKMAYNGWVQLVLDYSDRSRMKICVEEDFGWDENQALALLMENYGEINECITDKTGEVVICKQPKEAFKMSTFGGKVKNVVDLRTKE